MIRCIPYKEYLDCLLITNEQAELVIPVGFGPRIISYRLGEGDNIFAELPDATFTTPNGVWKPRGGHRLWSAPEHSPGSYTADDQPLQYRITGDYGVEISQLASFNHGLEKRMRIDLDPRSSGVRVGHTLVNQTVWPIEVAPWALSIMRSGGEAVVAQEPFRPHTKSFLPARTLTLWGYTQLHDPRFRISDELLRLRCDPSLSNPQKIGISNRPGWAMYLSDDQCFIKYACYQEYARYPDCGSSTEVFTAGDFLELETLGPLVLLNPGEKTEHEEYWQLSKVPKGFDKNDDTAIIEMLHRAKEER